ncbi:MAG: EthD domain-containing protein [Micrococcus sp.]|nr:EthD domain-containing protein [Micrococcus sp.]
MAVKLVYVARRRPELTPEEFREYWSDGHAALWTELQGVLGFRKYVQSHPLDIPFNAAFATARGMSLETPPDGVGEAWWDSVDELMAGFSGPEGKDAGRRLIEDEARFIDFATSRAFITQERQVL